MKTFKVWFRLKSVHCEYCLELRADRKILGSISTKIAPESGSLCLLYCYVYSRYVSVLTSGLMLQTDTYLRPLQELALLCFLSPSRVHPAPSSNRHLRRLTTEVAQANRKSTRRRHRPRSVRTGRVVIVLYLC